MGCNVKPRYRIFPAFSPHFLPNLTALIQILNYRIILAFFKNFEFAAFFDENLPNLTALLETTTVAGVTAT